MNTLYSLQMINHKSKLKACDNYQYVVRVKTLYANIFQVSMYLIHTSSIYSSLEQSFHRKYKNV